MERQECTTLTDAATSIGVREMRACIRTPTLLAA